MSLKKYRKNGPIITKQNSSKSFRHSDHPVRPCPSLRPSPTSSNFLGVSLMLFKCLCFRFALCSHGWTPESMLLCLSQVWRFDWKATTRLVRENGGGWSTLLAPTIDLIFKKHSQMYRLPGVTTASTPSPQMLADCSCPVVSMPRDSSSAQCHLHTSLYIDVH